MRSALNPPLNDSFGRRLMMAAGVLAILVLAWTGPLDEQAKKYVSSGLSRAMVTFATARTANAIISVVKSTTVSVPLIGGITASPGQILDPLDELIEQFSALMLAASMSLAAQRLLISLGGLTVVSAALSVAVVAWAMLQATRRGCPPWLARLAAILLFVRFAVPVAALASEAAYHAAMSDPYEMAQTEVESTSSSLLDRLGDLKAAAGKLKDPVQVWREVKGAAEIQVRHVITLMAIFTLQTIILPLGFLWATYRILGATMNSRGAPRWAEAKETA